MRDLINKARWAASQVLGDVVSVEFEQMLPIGEQCFTVRRQSNTHARVVMNPNGLRAGVEWRDEGQEMQYRIVRLTSSIPTVEDARQSIA
jgi:hypothetical protein